MSHQDAELFNEWYPRLVRFVHARLGNLDEAEDVAQEAFVRLLDERPRNPRAWLLTVATNIMRDHHRLAEGRSRRLAILASESVRTTPPADERLVGVEQAAHVREALAELAERDRTMLLLHHEGISYQEIAEQIGVAPSSVGSLLTRAHRRFLVTYEALHGSEDHAALG